MVEAETSFSYGDIAIFGNVAWPMARIFHQLSVGIYLDNARKTSKTYMTGPAKINCVVMQQTTISNRNTEFKRIFFKAYRIKILLLELKIFVNILLGVICALVVDFCRPNHIFNTCAY